MFFLKSYSQGKEDLMLAKLTKYKKNGFFIDVGANDPVKLNNTYLFYKMGWTGISFEPIPDLVEKIKLIRPRDIVINKAMSNFVGEANFLAGDDEYHVNSSLIDHKLPSQKSIRVSVDKLDNILEEYKVLNIDFLSIDTEGTEIDVLEGLNFEKYRPNFILAEYNTASKANDALIPYLVDKGYLPIYINTWNIIFSRNFSEDAILCFSQTNNLITRTFNFFRRIYINS